MCCSASSEYFGVNHCWTAWTLSEYEAMIKHESEYLYFIIVTLFLYRLLTTLGLEMAVKWESELAPSISVWVHKQKQTDLNWLCRQSWTLPNTHTCRGQMNRQTLPPIHLSLFSLFSLSLCVLLSSSPPLDPALRPCPNVFSQFIHRKSQWSMFQYLFVCSPWGITGCIAVSFKS